MWDYSLTNVLRAVDWILKYVKYVPGKGLSFTKAGHLKIEAYSDANWVGSHDDRRFTSHYTYLGGNLVTLSSKK